jgi:hypothetical protein
MSQLMWTLKTSRMLVRQAASLKTPDVLSRVGIVSTKGQATETPFARHNPFCTANQL